MINCIPNNKRLYEICHCDMSKKNYSVKKIFDKTVLTNNY